MPSATDRSDVMRIDWGDGVSALDRTMRAAVMLADGAIQSLVEKGWDRDADEIDVYVGDPEHAQGHLAKIRFRGRYVYAVSISPSASGEVITITGRWTSKVGRIGWLRRRWRTWRAGARAS